MGAVGLGAGPAQCLASVPTQGDALGTPPQPVTELCSKKSCWQFVIISANTISSYAAAFLREMGKTSPLCISPQLAHNYKVLPLWITESLRFLNEPVFNA